ncbi:hypothetical protein [Lysobacter gummosus]
MPEGSHVTCARTAGSARRGELVARGLDNFMPLANSLYDRRKNAFF